MLAMIETVEPHLPAQKPRYLMGVGTPDDLLRSVERGVDMFDCVMPTRAGRHGLAYTRHGRINLRNARHAEDTRPLDEASACPAARDYSRAYLHHLVRSDEILGMMLLTWNNLAYYQDLMAGMRAAIRRAGSWPSRRRPAWAGSGRGRRQGRSLNADRGGPSPAKQGSALHPREAWGLSTTRPISPQGRASTR